MFLIKRDGKTIGQEAEFLKAVGKATAESLVVVGIDKVTRTINGETVVGSIVSIWTGTTVKHASFACGKPW
jgi:hypothetical protein